MKSRNFHLTSVAPIAVALTLTLASAAGAQQTAQPAEPQLLIASPLDAVADSLPMSLFTPERQPVFDPKENETEPATTPNATEETPVTTESPKVETQATAPQPAAQEEAASAPVYSPAHLELDRKIAEVPSSEAQEQLSKPLDAARKIEKAQQAQLEKQIAPDGSIDEGSAKGVADKTPIATLDETAKAEDAKQLAESGDLHVQLRGVDGGTTGDTGSAETTLSPADIAQTVPTDTLQGQTPNSNAGDTRDFDLTPVSLPRRTPNFNSMEGMQYGMLYRLPPKLFFSAVVDNSLRLETNVFQTKSHYKQDMIYRILPNVTVGYALARKTRVSANYFFLRDQYTTYAKSLDRNFHSVGFQIDQDLYVKNRTSVTLGFFGRALFTTPDQFSDQFFNDLLPSLTVTRQVGYHGVLYASVLGQIRFREMLSQFQEGDQFYSFGGTYRNKGWTLLGDFTLNNNFGNSNLRQGNDNQVIILTEEVAHRIPVPYLRSLPVDGYLRCQQIFNMGANNSPGYAGVNTRVFGGIRAYVAKPPIFPVKLAGK